ncbi:TetR/AcrR family transcriptional regulator [Flavobacterium gilvum]|uniref:HTH tetR-type domain-containing protein n=1 Tax=Flavobacterium gilvum TaxID=1492737 RepID=A0AAC9N4U8_9FLAO|nr:TetR/AcrR family transcriptional regulator [Flavobacterium gilvum]AOW08786.1 hypothetical protein EM308_04295 [Flavobacterium gilvum]KFC59151.1 hypothetical protein FEM08_20780 [Flavobacterium gilvum]
MDKKQAILETALKLFVDNGFHGTATSKIASYSGVATGTLFNYFKTKEELIFALYHLINKEMDDYIVERMGFLSVSKESFQFVFSAAVSWSLEKPYHFRYLQQFNHSPFSKVSGLAVLNKEENPVCVLIQNGIDVVLIKQLPVLFIYMLFCSQTSGLYDYISSNKFESAQQSELIEEAFEMFWKMIED